MCEWTATRSTRASSVTSGGMIGAAILFDEASEGEGTEASVSMLGNGLFQRSKRPKRLFACAGGYSGASRPDAFLNTAYTSLGIRASSPGEASSRKQLSPPVLLKVWGERRKPFEGVYECSRFALLRQLHDAAFWRELAAAAEVLLEALAMGCYTELSDSRSSTNNSGNCQRIARGLSACRSNEAARDILHALTRKAQQQRATGLEAAPSAAEGWNIDTRYIGLSLPVLINSFKQMRVYPQIVTPGALLTKAVQAFATFGYAHRRLLRCVSESLCFLSFSDEQLATLRDAMASLQHDDPLLDALANTRLRRAVSLGRANTTSGSNSSKKQLVKGGMS
ncbi:hypothetical protein cyc_02207 [Cyclospora cayetanensis]|uniref:Uncharacterized protein n=1 Tax=Cyclospora cayetanensis TaxID=88456 RepID=A0A1D3D1R5_9EIME|nr:hypothetical protein cyc_02207 [Cyclospora cayetanensis]